MTDTPPNPQENLSDEFRRLGQNLVDTMRSAWDSPERKRLQDEIGDGLDELAKTIRLEVDAFQQSPTGQRIRSDVEDFRQRVRKGEVEEKLREDLLAALRAINDELKKVSARWSEPGGEQPGAAPAPTPGQDPTGKE